MKKHLFLLLIICSGLQSCVNTRITSFSNPNYQHRGFKRLLVSGNYSDFEYRKQCENAVTQALADQGVYAVAYSRVLPPVDEYSDSEINVTLNRYQIDALLIISPGEVTTNSVLEFNPRTNFGSSHQSLNSAIVFGKLFDLSTSKVAWRAQADNSVSQYQGEALVGMESIFTSSGEKFTEDLLSQGLIASTLKH